MLTGLQREVVDYLDYKRFGDARCIGEYLRVDQPDVQAALDGLAQKGFVRGASKYPYWYRLTIKLRDVLDR
jgi:DNA-binding MarR family transcriptional regulator